MAYTKYEAIAEVVKNYVEQKTAERGGRLYSNLDVAQVVARLYTKPISSEQKEWLRSYIYALIDEMRYDVSSILSYFDKQVCADEALLEKVRTLIRRGHDKPQKYEIMHASVMRLLRRCGDVTIADYLVQNFNVFTSHAQKAAIDYLKDLALWDLLAQLYPGIKTMEEDVQFVYLYAVEAWLQAKGMNPVGIRILKDYIKNNPGHLEAVMHIMTKLDPSMELAIALKDKLPTFIKEKGKDDQLDELVLLWINMLLQKYPILITDALIEAVLTLPEITTEAMRLFITLMNLKGDTTYKGMRLIEAILKRLVEDGYYSITDEDAGWIQKFVDDQAIEYLLKLLGDEAVDVWQRDRIYDVLGFVKTDNPQLAKKLIRLALKARKRGTWWVSQFGNILKELTK